jgi:hypothetical protein
LCTLHVSFQKACDCNSLLIHLSSILGQIEDRATVTQNSLLRSLMGSSEMDGWPKMYLVSLCFEKHVKPSVPAPFAVASTSHWARVITCCPFSCIPIHTQRRYLPQQWGLYGGVTKILIHFLWCSG